MRSSGKQWRSGDHPFDREGWVRSGGRDGTGWSTWPRARSLRLWVPVIASFFVQIPFAVVRVIRPDAVETERPIALLNLGLALVGPLALIAARRFPGPVVAVATAAASADLLLREPAVGPPYVAIAFAIVGAVARGARVWAWVSLAVGWVATVIGGVLLDVQWRPPAVAGITFGILVVLGIGEAVRTRRERFEEASRSARSRRQSAVEAERVRIARELHDVLAHSLSQINVQAGVGLHLIEAQPRKAAEALANIKESSKTALDEVRAVLGVLRSEDGGDVRAALVPEPHLSRLHELTDSVESSQRSVSLDLDFDPTLDAPSAVQFAVYRIVQEALTNVVRHSRAGAVQVRVEGRRGVVTVTVSDDGRGTAPPVPGRGLIGMRERAELLGGSLRVDVDDGFTVVATIPVRRGPDATAGVDR